MRPNDFITYDCALPECEALTFGILIEKPPGYARYKLQNE